MHPCEVKVEHNLLTSYLIYQAAYVYQFIHVAKLRRKNETSKLLQQKSERGGDAATAPLAIWRLMSQCTCPYDSQ